MSRDAAAEVLGVDAVLQTAPPSFTTGDAALIAWGATTARLGRALRSFIHPNAIRRLPWDVQHAASVRPMLAAVTDPELRKVTEAVLDRYDVAVAPRWSQLRCQAIHSDLTT